MPLKNDVTLAVSDNTSMNAYVSRPEGDGPFPGMILFQEAFGVNHHIRSVADRMAKEWQYVVIAPELFHRTAPGLQAGYDDYPSIAPHMEALTIEGLEADARAAYNFQQVNLV